MTLTLEKLLNREKGAEPALIAFATRRTCPKIYGGQVSRETLGLETLSIDHSVSRTTRQKKLCLCPCRARCSSIVSYGLAMGHGRHGGRDGHGWWSITKWISALSSEAPTLKRMLASRSAQANAGTASRRRSLGGFGAFAPELSCLVHLGRSGTRFRSLSALPGRCARGIKQLPNVHPVP